MLTSIHPLGERARSNRWWLTAGAFTFASVLTAALVGAALGALGGLVLPDGAAVEIAVGGVVVMAAALDLAGIAPPGPHRQVNERWIGSFRGWVYGGAFGAQLGAAVATYIVTWLVPAMLATELASGSAGAGAMIGAAFGLGRAVPVLAARWIDRPSRLVSMSSAMARLARPTFLSLAILAGVIGVAGMLVGSR